MRRRWIHFKNLELPTRTLLLRNVFGLGGRANPFPTNGDPIEALGHIRFYFQDSLNVVSLSSDLSATGQVNGVGARGDDATFNETVNYTSNFDGQPKTANVWQTPTGTYTAIAGDTGSPNNAGIFNEDLSITVSGSGEFGFQLVPSVSQNDMASRLEIERVRLDGVIISNTRRIFLVSRDQSGVETCRQGTGFSLTSCSPKPIYWVSI